MTHFPTTPEEFNERLLEFKRPFLTREDEENYYKSILRRVENKYDLNLQDIQFLDFECLALLPPPNNWIKIFNKVIDFHDNYYELNPSLKTYILQHEAKLNDLNKINKLVSDINTANIVANKIDVFNTIVSLATSYNFNSEIKSIFEDRAIYLLRRDPTKRRYVPLQLRNLSIAALATNALDPLEQKQVQERKQPTIRDIQTELKLIIERSNYEIKERLNDILIQLDIINEQTNTIKGNHQKLMDQTNKILRIQKLRFWSREWWFGK